MKQSEKIDLNDPAAWKEWAEDELHLLDEEDWKIISLTGKYRGSIGKAQALIIAHDMNSSRK